MPITGCTKGVTYREPSAHSVSLNGKAATLGINVSRGPFGLRRWGYIGDQILLRLHVETV